MIKWLNSQLDTNCNKQEHKLQDINWTQLDRTTTSKYQNMYIGTGFKIWQHARYEKVPSINRHYANRHQNTICKETDMQDMKLNWKAVKLKSKVKNLECLQECFCLTSLARHGYASAKSEYCSQGPQSVSIPLFQIGIAPNKVWACVHWPWTPCRSLSFWLSLHHRKRCQ